MGGSWVEHFDLIAALPGRGDTVIGHDVWFGDNAMVMPGVRIGHGAIIASGTLAGGASTAFGFGAGWTGTNGVPSTVTCTTG